MYHIELSPSEGGAAPMGAAQAVTIAMRENRSTLSQEARGALTTILALAMLLAIVPAFSGHYLVPICVLSSMALLVATLEWHGRQRIAEERIHLDGRTVALSNSAGLTTALPMKLTRLEYVAGPSRLSLFLHTHWSRIEIGRCLSLDEKRDLIPVLEGVMARFAGEAA